MSDITQPQNNLWDTLKPYLATPWTVTILVPILVAFLDPANFSVIVTFAFNAFMGTLPYIAFAVLLIAASPEDFAAERFGASPATAVV